MPTVKKIALKQVVLQQADKSLLTVHPVNIIQRSKLFDYLEEIQKYIMDLEPKYKQGLTFLDIWDADPFFCHLCKEAVREGGLNPDLLDINTIYSLLMPYYDEETQEVQKQGILVSLNFSPSVLNLDKSEEVSKDKLEEQQTLSQMLGSLWTSTESVGDAMQLIEALPADSLLEVLQQRNKIVTEINEKSQPLMTQGKRGPKPTAKEGKRLREEYREKQRKRLEAMRKKKGG